MLFNLDLPELLQWPASSTALATVYFKKEDLTLLLIIVNIIMKSKLLAPESFYRLYPKDKKRM